ncbi:excinuclease ABC subunit UvrB [Gemmatimonadota bacterium]
MERRDVPFDLVKPFEPAGDQPNAIEQLISGLERDDRYQTLLGVTGSGKTFTMANVIARVNRPVLVISHNKTLAAQLYGELRGFFPHNAVEYFISYYDYYQPEAYLPGRDLYIEKETSVNELIERLRLRTTSALLERRDVIVVASVSCIYGLGNPEDTYRMLVGLEKGQELDRQQLLRALLDLQYRRNDIAFERGTFRVRGDVVEVHLAYEESAVRIEFWGDEIEGLSIVDLLTGEIIEERERVIIFPSSHFLTSREKVDEILAVIEEDAEREVSALQDAGKLVEAQRLKARSKYDLEMMAEVGWCTGIENYSRYFDGRSPGDRPNTLIDYFPDDFLTIIDESHVTVPQIGGMYAGDRSRKENLVEFGFRLEAALDNRPLQYPEFEALQNNIVFVSATPGDFELERCGGAVVEQVVRPSGLLDPDVVVRPVAGQIDDLLEEIRKRVERGERTLVTTLTKKMSEDLTDYLIKVGVRARYMHSEIDALDRVEVLRGLRMGDFDVLVGINLLREGLDMPEVSLVVILDADKEGFLRSETSLVQTMGRAARNANGLIIMYADRMTGSMERAISEVDRRREIQKAWNVEHGIEPATLVKTPEEVMASTSLADVLDPEGAVKQVELEVETLMKPFRGLSDEGWEMAVEQQMLAYAAGLDFEKATVLRDELARYRTVTGGETGPGSGTGDGS